MPSGPPTAAHPAFPDLKLRDGEKAGTIVGFAIPEGASIKIYPQLDDHSIWYSVAATDVLFHEILDADPLSPTVFIVKPNAIVTFHKVGDVAAQLAFLEGPFAATFNAPTVPTPPKDPRYTHITNGCLIGFQPPRRF